VCLVTVTFIQSLPHFRYVTTTALLTLPYYHYLTLTSFLSLSHPFPRFYHLTEGVPGEDLVIDSDGFFDLEVQPKKVGVIGAGYIAVELAGVFNGLGTDTTLFVRKECALRNFDTMLSAHLDKNLKHAGRHAALYAFLAMMSVCFSHANQGQKCNANQSLTQAST
jgi:Pyridine nucleotide-disulphide oxidoreductase